MQNCAIYHDSAIFVLPLVSLPFKVKYFYITVFTRSEKPLILFLKAHSYDIRRESIEIHLLVLVAGPQIVNFNKPV
jgi:hypothetical protein